MKYIMPKEVILNTMITIYEQEGRRIINHTDIENYQEMLREKFREEGLDIVILGWGVDYIDDERIFKGTYFSASRDKKRKILEHYLNGDILYNEEILTCLCPFKGNSKVIQYYIMFPWIEMESLYELKENLEISEYGILESTLEEQTPTELEKLLECERKVSCFFTDSLNVEITCLQEKSEYATKVLNKIRKVSNHAGK